MANLMSKKANFRGLIAKIACLRTILASIKQAMNHFHELYHGNCTLRYIGGVLELRNINFRSLKGQFDVKKAHFRGLNQLLEAYFDIYYGAMYFIKLWLSYWVEIRASDWFFHYLVLILLLLFWPKIQIFQVFMKLLPWCQIIFKLVSAR